jgi:hypothetical protein
MSNPDNTEWSDFNKFEFTALPILKPEFSMINIQVGSGSVIGENNIEQFLNFVRKSDDFKKKSIAELAPNYETAIASLVQMLEARFVNMHPIMQHMFLALHDMKNGEKKDFVLETLHEELGDGAKEARMIFAKYKMFDCYTDVMKILRTRRENRAKYSNQPFAKNGLKIPIPYKMMALHDTLENNFGWIVPENLFDEESVPKRKEKENSETSISSIQCIVDKTFKLSLYDLDLDNT